jgi:hypothetical protein
MNLSVSGCIRALALAAFVAGAPLPAAADDVADQVAELKRQLASSMKQIEALSARLQAVEAASAANTSQSAATKPSESGGRIEALEQEVGQLRDSVARGSQDTGVPLHGFADAGWREASKSTLTGQQGGATVGTFDIYLTPQISDRIRSLFEIAFEYGHLDGQIGSDVERGQLGYVVNDNLLLWAGRFHTPYGYWNTEFHHGAQIQTSITRPTFLEFEDKGGVMPSHSTGLWATGGMAAGGGRANYDVYVANGSRIAEGQIDFNALHDDNNNKAVGGRLSYQFGGALDGLTIGAHGLTEEVDVYGSVGYQIGTGPGAVQTNLPTFRTRLGMAGAYAVYDADDWEALAEYYHFGNKDLSGSSGSHTSWAGFVQVGRAITPRWIPYARFEEASLDQTDRYFSSLTLGGQSYKRGVLGIRYNISAKSAFKLEANHTKQTDAPLQDYNELRAQYSIRF